MVYAKAKEGKPVEEANCAPIIRNPSKYGKSGAEVNRLAGAGGTGLKQIVPVCPTGRQQGNVYR
jgi:hypothetical protein